MITETIVSAEQQRLLMQVKCGFEGHASSCANEFLLWQITS